VGRRLWQLGQTAGSIPENVPFLADARVSSNLNKFKPGSRSYHPTGLVGLKALMGTKCPPAHDEVGKVTERAGPKRDMKKTPRPITEWPKSRSSALGRAVFRTALSLFASPPLLSTVIMGGGRLVMVKGETLGIEYSLTQLPPFPGPNLADEAATVAVEYGLLSKN